MKIIQNIIRLNRVVINSIGEVFKKIVRYVPDNEVPDTHVDFYGADGEQFYGSDDRFLGKL